MSLRLVVRSSAAAALLVALVLPALPSSAAGRAPQPVAEPQHLTLVRDAGMPTTDVPARTLASADAWTRLSTEATTQVTVTVTLGAAPTTETAADLRIALGRPGETGCAVVDAWSVRTDAPEYADPSAPEGVPTITVTRDLPAGDVAGSPCLVVAVSDPAEPAGADLDRWSAGTDRFVPMRATPGQARIVDVAHTRLPVREWSWVQVRLRVRFHGVSSIRVDGRGPDLRVQPVVLTREFAKGERVVVTVPVKLCARKPRALRLDTAVAGVALPLIDRERVRIRPR